MSKYYNTHAADSVVRVIQSMSNEEIEQQYGIEIDENGCVWDECEGRSFRSVQEWALYMDECEGLAYEAATHRGSSRYDQYDDDY